MHVANFFAIHQLFDDAASPVIEASVLMAECAAWSDGTADGTARVASSKSYLVPYGSGDTDQAKKSAQSAPLSRLEGGRVVADLTQLKKAAGSSPAASL